MTQQPPLIGRVTRSSTRGFVGAIRLPEPDIPVFGSFCKADAQQGRSSVIGLIYDISVEDDGFTRQIATSPSAKPEEIADAQFNRHVPVEFSAVAVGYLAEDGYRYALPPQPPLSMATIQSMLPGEVRDFTRRTEWFSLVLGAPEIPADELLVAAIRFAAQARPQSERPPFLREAGGRCARLLGRDLVRLETVLGSLSG